MKIGDLVKYRSMRPEADFSSWLGIIIWEIPGTAEHKKVRWVNTDNGKVETVSHKAQDLRMVNENW